MQKTNQYQFNLIENTDPFSPAPLNENMEKVEGALEEAARRITDLDSRGVKMACGSYTGTGAYGANSPTALTFGFSPKFLVVCEGNSRLTALRDGGNAVGFRASGSGSNYTDSAWGWYCTAAWEENGVSWYHAKDDTSQFNGSGKVYHYLALG